MEKARNRAEWTKMKALLSELRSLRSNDPHARVVVFTQYAEVQQAVVQTLYREEHGAYTIYSFNQQTPVAIRHRLIREFQNVPSSGSKPAVCVATYATAAVGITLTAASKVILMEPCLDASLEAQAAGRIHRLGQTKEVLIKRFCYKDTVEQAIADVHSAQRSGALSTRELQDCGGARSVTRNASVQSVPTPILDAFRAHGVDTPHRLPASATAAGASSSSSSSSSSSAAAGAWSAAGSEPVRKDTGKTRYDATTYAHEAVWEWFLVRTSHCLDCGVPVQLEGKCIFRGLASERAAKEAEIERCERRLRRVAEYKQRLTTKEYRTGKKKLTELQEAEVEAEEWITDRLEALQAKMVDDDGIEYYTHPSAASSSGSGGGGPSGGRYGGYGFGARGFGAYSDDDDAYMYDDGYR